MDYSTEINSLDYGTTTDASQFFFLSGVWLFFWLAVAVLIVVGLWKVFEKAKQPGWAAIIPFYNLYILLKIVGRPGWWLILYLIPIVGLIVTIIVSIDLAKSFGKSAAFGVFGLWLFSYIGYLMLGFGDARYQGPAVKA